MISVGATHWATILDNIKNIHEYFDFNNEPEAVITSYPSSVDFFLGPLETITMANVISSIPPRAITDALMSVYSTAASLISVGWLHPTKLRREYEMFWANPDSMCFMWISSLFSVLNVLVGVATAPRQDIPAFSPQNFSSLMLGLELANVS